MKPKIELLVKFGIPVIILLITALIFFSDKSTGNGEFGSIRTSELTFIILALLLPIYFIAGIIVWIKTKQNSIFLSAIFSIIIFFTINFISKKINKHNDEIFAKNTSIEYQQELEVFRNKIDSLDKEIRINPKNYKAIEECVLIYTNNLKRKKHSSKEDNEKYTKYLEILIQQKTKNAKLYHYLSKYYQIEKEYNKAIDVYKTALKYDSLKQIQLSEEEIKNINIQIKNIELKTKS